mgnify:CR=1 FL=1
MIFVGFVFYSFVQSVEAAVSLFIGIEEDLIGSGLGHADGEAEEGLGRMEGKDEDQAASLVGQDLPIRVEEELGGRRGGEEFLFFDNVIHLRIRNTFKV